jgi:hypothetical protein
MLCGGGCVTLAVPLVAAVVEVLAVAPADDCGEVGSAAVAEAAARTIFGANFGASGSESWERAALGFGAGAASFEHEVQAARRHAAKQK